MLPSIADTLNKMIKLFNSLFHITVIIALVLPLLAPAIPLDSAKRTRNEHEVVHLSEIERISSEPVPTALPAPLIVNTEVSEQGISEATPTDEEQTKLVPSPTTNQIGNKLEPEVSTSPTPIVQSEVSPTQTPKPTPNLLEQIQVNGPSGPFCNLGRKKRNCLRIWRCDINVYRHGRRNRRRWSYWSFCESVCRIKAGSC